MGNRRISLLWLAGILGAGSVLLYGCGGSTETSPAEAPDSAAIQQTDLHQNEPEVAATPAPTHTIVPTWTPPPPPTSTPPTITWYVSGAENANVRACGSADCEIVNTLAYGDPIQVLSMENGWHAIQMTNGTIAYIAAWLTSQTPSEAQTVVTVPPFQFQPTAPPSYNWNCNGNLYDCTDFSSCAEAKGYLRACPGDPSHIDGDGDGIPCERGVCSW